MTESEHPSATGPEHLAETGTPSARIRRTPWRGWLMAVPLAALILVGYLAVRTWLLAGPTITVTFPKSEGIGPQGTVVKYKGLQVGSVTGVSFIDNLQRIKVTLDMKSSVADALNSNTQFWIVSPSIMSGNVSSLLSGAYIAMRPGDGEPQDHFTGTIGPPATPPDKAGTVVTLTTDNRNALGHGSVVEYRGLIAGEVLGADYDQQNDEVRLRLFVDAPYSQHLGQRTRFWRIGEFSVSSGSGGLAVKTPNLKPLIKGGVAFADIGARSRPDKQSSDAKHLTYRLYDSRSDASAALAGPKATFSLDPRGSLEGLTSAASVTLSGVRVGRVTATRVQYDPAAHRIATAATIEIFAAPLGIASDQESGNESGVQVENALNDLIKHGLRARLASPTPVIGSEQVVLSMTDRDGSSGLDRTREPPGIPMVPNSGINGLVDSLSQIASKVNAVPIADIGHNLKQLAANARKLSASPKIDDALANLNHSLANVEAITAGANGQVKPMLKSLRAAAKAAESAAQQISQLSGGPGVSTANIQKLVAELTRAARSIRVLTSYLQTHPEALLRGR